jgi:hypothetical protein
MNWLVDLGLGYFLVYGSCWAHELGHALMATILIARPTSVRVSWRLHGQTTLVYIPSRWTPWRGSLTLLAGPVAGMLWMLGLTWLMIAPKSLRPLILTMGLLLHGFQLLPMDNSDGHKIMQLWDWQVSPRLQRYVWFGHMGISIISGMVVTYWTLSDSSVHV